tara:strand:- start:54 stop:509 length:456 start_codon:yes stop_codon:yes gene_type:complete
MRERPDSDVECAGQNAPVPLARARLAVVAMPALLAACRDDQGFALPSGLEVELIEILTEPQPFSQETWVIVRVLAPGLAEQEISVEARAADTDMLCAEWGQPAAMEAPEPPEQIVIQMMSETVERGRASPGVAQAFAGYRFQNGLCIWEDF